MLERTNYYDVKEPESTEGKDLSLQFDPFKKYLAEIRRYPVLTREEEQKISRLVFDHQDMDAAQKLTVSNLKIVVKIAMRYHNTYHNTLDLIQEGNVGLLHAVKKYNPYKGTKFSSYAALWIKAYILKFLMDSWSLVKTGTTQAQRKLFYGLNSEKRRLESLGIDPTPKLLASNFGLKEWEVEDMEKRLSHTDIALDVPIYEGSDETLMDRMSSDDDVEEIVSARYESVIFSKKLKKFKATLDDRDLYIFNNRVVADEPMSLQEIGDSCRISRERVRQVEIRIVKRLRTHFQGSLAELGLQNTNGNIGATQRAM
ncbi:MAG: RNA polymerase subunit sigma-70 [Syntrophus sp. (in: bacteria)]|nr:RNA polymerase subunit sigma-70 [Syntrophus sp. (in: bacteria)]